MDELTELRFCATDAGPVNRAHDKTTRCRKKHDLALLHFSWVFLYIVDDLSLCYAFCVSRDAGVMMTTRLATLIMFMLVTSSAARADELFPAQPATFNACYEAGQHWIRARMPELNASVQPSREQFNAALAACTARVPAAAQWKWPVELAYLGKAPYKNFFMQDGRGDWFVASYTESSDSALTYLRMPKNGKKAELTSSVPLNGYFFGFDFAPYEMNKAGRAFGSLTAFLTKQASTLYFELLGRVDGAGRLLLQSQREVIAYDTQNKTWFWRKCLLQLAPAPDNDLPKIIEKCRTTDAANVASLVSGTAISTRAPTSKTLQWNGKSFEEGEPTAWLAERNAPPIKFPAILSRTVKGEATGQDGLQFRRITQTQGPRGRNPVVTNETIEILKGLPAEAARKINADIARTVAGATDGTIEPEVRDEQGSKTLYYGEMISRAQLASFARGFVVVRFSSSTMAPLHRSYDDTAYVLYDARSGVRRDMAALFNTPRELDLFAYGATARFKAPYLFPKRWSVKDAGQSTGSLIVIPRPAGLEVLAGDGAGGHYVEDSLGMVPNADIASTLRTGQLQPRLQCAPGMERPEEQRLCAEKLVGDYETLLRRWQSRLEDVAGNAAAADKLSEEHAAFLEKIAACPDKDRACLKQRLDEQSAALH
ncbi:hypothetical protein [Janthinobacterium sp. RB2R34]|uniref:hypothetical protein n=1 Tax=Janthinobacterium sp. RB2R34 TaxID=3424193 RepID=UPI003F20FAB7